MEFEGKVQKTMHGIYASNYEHEGKKLKVISTQFESHHAREAFPCIDEPEAKATFDLTLTSPAGEAVIANTPIKAQTSKNGRAVTTFETTPKMSTYLLAFVYGDLQYKETQTKDGVAVRIWATKVHPLEAFDFPLETAKKAIEFFNDYYGVPYPLAKSDHVAIPDFSSAAMENWGLITYREPYLLADPSTTSQSFREIIVEVIGHETSHQWFGNLVTMKWWDNLWLNESFANVMAYVAEDAMHPDWQIWNAYITSDGLSALRRDSIAGVQSVKTPVRHPDEIGTLFDPSIVYAKGGRLLKTLIEYVGEDDFRTGLTRYFEKHAYGNTTGDDLWAAIAQASGKDVGGFMNPWLDRPGYPVISVNQNGQNLEISQQHFLLDPGKADLTRIWPVPLLSSNPEVPELLSTKAAKKKLSSSDYIRLNQGATGHYIVNYTNPAHMSAIASLVDTKQLGVAERLMLLSDSSMLARARMQSFLKTLELLEHYRTEDSEPVWDIMALIIADVRRFIDIEPEIEDRIKAMIRTLIEAQYKRLGWEEKANESSQDTKLRATIIGLGVYAGHPDILKRALELFEAYKTDENAVSSEFRAIIFGAAIRNEVTGAFEYLLELEETTPKVDIKLDAVSALTLVKSPQYAEKLLGRLKDTNKVRPHDVDRWLVNLMRNRYARDQAWQWLKDEWGWIEKTFGGDKSYDYFPRYAASVFNTRKLMDEFIEFFEPKKDQLALTRNITMGIEELGNRIDWLEHDRADVVGYFTADPVSHS
jgi:aminopeptidase N